MCFSLKRVIFIAITDCWVKKDLKLHFILKRTFSLQMIIRENPVNHTMKGEKNYFKGKLASSLE